MLMHSAVDDLCEASLRSRPRIPGTETYGKGGRPRAFGSEMVWPRRGSMLQVNCLRARAWAKKGMGIPPTTLHPH